MVRPRFSAYVEASKAVFAIFDDTAPTVEAVSIDEAFLDVRGLEKICGTPGEIGVRLRRRVRAEVGLPLSIGVASTKHLARSRPTRAKPDGLRIVAAGREAAFLHPLPVEALWGVGPATQDGCTRRASARSASWRPQRATRWPSCSAARRTPAPRDRPQPRPAPRALRARPPLDRLAVGAGPRVQRTPAELETIAAGSSTASPAAARRAGASGGPWSCACASATTPARRARGRWPGPPRRRAPILADAWPAVGHGATDHRAARHHAAGHPPRDQSRTRHRRRAARAAGRRRRPHRAGGRAGRRARQVRHERPDARDVGGRRRGAGGGWLEPNDPERG